MRRRVGTTAWMAVGISLFAILLVSSCSDSRQTLHGHRQEARPAKTTTKSRPSDGPSQSHGPSQSLARGPISAGWNVTRVIDGDTVEVQRANRELTVRLIGIDTPETVHPTEPIECFGPQATHFANQQLLGRRVTLEYDPSQGRRDYYHRTLAYLWLPRGDDRMFNRTAIRRGYALEYTYDTAYRWQREFRDAESKARSDRLGVWRCADPGS